MNKEILKLFLTPGQVNLVTSLPEDQQERAVLIILDKINLNPTITIDNTKLSDQLNKTIISSSVKEYNALKSEVTIEYSYSERRYYKTEELALRTEKEYGSGRSTQDDIYKFSADRITNSSRTIYPSNFSSYGITFE